MTWGKNCESKNQLEWTDSSEDVHVSLLTCVYGGQRKMNTIVVREWHHTWPLFLLLYEWPIALASHYWPFAIGRSLLSKSRDENMWTHLTSPGQFTEWAWDAETLSQWASASTETETLTFICFTYVRPLAFSSDGLWMNGHRPFCYSILFHSLSSFLIVFLALSLSLSLLSFQLTALPVFSLSSDYTSGIKWPSLHWIYC